MKHIEIRYTVMAIFLTLVLLSSADCKPKSPGDNDADNCFGDMSVGGECDGALCYCCYDNGCWICDNMDGDESIEPANCVWDPSYRKKPGKGIAIQGELPINSPESGKHPFKPPKVIQTEPITVSPDSGKVPIKQPGETVQAGPTIINFDDLVTGGLGTGGPIPVTNQYAPQGVTFNGPVAIDFSKGTAIPGFAHSGTNAIEQCYAAEFCTAPIEIKFSQGQSRIKVWVGYDTTNNEKTPIILRAFDASGKQVAQDSENLMEGGPTPIQIPLEVSTINKRNPTLTRSNIIRVTVDFADENRFTNGLAVDDVEFQRVEGILPDIEPQLVKDSSGEMGTTNKPVPDEGDLKVQRRLHQKASQT